MMLALLVMGVAPDIGSISLQRASLEITPPELLPLGGYTARGGKVSEPGGDPLYARVAVLRQGDTAVALVSAEMLTIPESLYREVAKRIGPKLDLFLVATHTHCAPDSQMLNDRMTMAIPGIAGYKRRWLEWYADRIAEAVVLTTRSPVQTGTVDYRIGKLPLNRGRRQGALPEPFMTEISIGGRPVVDIFAAHATFWGSERKTTAGDWPGALATSRGALVFPGAIGDVSPAAPGDTPEERIAAFVAQVSSKLPLQSGNRIADRGASDLKFVREPIVLDKPAPHPDFAKSNGIPEVLAQSMVDRFAPSTGEISALRIGKLAVVGVPGEPTSHLGRSIRQAGQRLGFDWVVVTSHTNGWIGYILDPQDYDRGGYEATLAFHGKLAGDRVVEAATAALRKLVRR